MRIRPTTTYGAIIPGSDYITSLVRQGTISREAAKRLRWMDHYSRCQNARLTCRYFGISAQTAESPYAKYLTAADVEQISGITGIMAVGRNPMKGFGGDLNFAKADGKMVVTAKFYDANWYAGSKRNQETIKAMVPGIGDEAYIGPGYMDPQYVLVFLKGQQCVFLSTSLDPNDPTKTVLTLDQLKEIGKLVASRL